MVKTLIISQEQLNEVLDGDVYYLADETSFGKIGNNETMINPLSDANTETVTGDKISRWMGKSSAYFGPGSSDHSYRTVGLMREDDKEYTKEEFDELMEINQGLKNIHMTSVDSNGKVVDGNESVLAKHKTEAKQRGDKKAYEALSQTLENHRAITKRRKETNKALGLPGNQYHKAPKKLGGLPNNNNITYFK